MILHLIHDDKFIDAAYRAFEEANSNKNEFVIIGKKQPLKYIKKTPIRFIERREFWSKPFLKSLHSYDMVVLHWLDDEKIQLLARADLSVKFVWIGWGGDYYDLITGDNTKLLKVNTLTLHHKNHIKLSNISWMSKIKKLFKMILSKKVEKQHIINRINYFSPVLYEDYQLLQKSLPNFLPHYLSWNYGTLEDDMIRGFEDSVISGNNILVGNSATYENNHLDIFVNLVKVKTEENQIIAPLSYGDMHYRDEIIHAGKRIFSEHFMPVTDFMPIADYVKILTSCSFAIMGHLRQQAVGNIVIMIYLGAKVFLDKQNPVYIFFKQQNAWIYALDELEGEFGSKLSPKQIEYNRTILRAHWSKKVILNKTKQLIETVQRGKNA